MNPWSGKEITDGAPVPARSCWLLAALIILTGFLFRGAYYYGYYWVPDEEITMRVVGHMRQSGDWDTNWAKADLPANLRYDQYNFSGHLYATYFFYRFVKLLPGLEEWRSREEGVAVYRLFSVALATFAIWQSLQIGRRAGGWVAGLAAAALTAVASQLVQDGHYIRPEAFTTVLTLGVVALCWPRPSVSPRRIVGAGFLIGVLIATKISMLLLVWLPLVPLVAAECRRQARWILLGLVPCAVVIGFGLGAPGALFHPERFLSGVSHLSVQYAGVHPPHSHLAAGAVGDILARFYVSTLGWPLLACALVGAVTLVARRRWAEVALLVGPVLVFAGYFATRSVFFERNVSHVLPLVFILSALGIVALAKFCRNKMRGSMPMWAMIVLAVLLVRPVRLSWALVEGEMSQRGMLQRGQLEDGLKARYATAKWETLEPLVPSDLAPLAAHFAARGGPVLLRVADSHDEWAADMLARLVRQFEAQHLGDSAGLFPGVPVSTLVVYHSPESHYFLVTGLRATRP